MGLTRNQYLFYVDNDNIIHDVKQEKGKDWEHGSLSTLGVKCAHYSRLTAATPIDTYPYPIVSVYYQVPPGEEEDPETTIESVYLYYGAWKKGPVYLDDPPLSGCSISAVPAEQGIWFDQEKENDKLHQPVVFFQNEDLTLMTGQLKGMPSDNGFRDVLSDLIAEQSSIKVKVKLPPHASISAVDNGTDCYCFYVADDNKINYIKIDSAGKVTNLGGLMTTTPRSDLTAVFYNQGSVEQIVLFYQVHHDTVARTYASTLTKSTTASVETWTTSVARHVFWWQK